MRGSHLHQSFNVWSATKPIDDVEAIALYQAAARIGYAAVEMAPPHRWAAARQAGLKLLNIAAPGMQAGLNRPEHHATLLPQIAELIDVAAREKIPQIIVFSGNRNGQANDDGIHYCVEALSSLAAKAESNGVTLLLELLGQKVHPDYQADNISFGAKVVRAVNSPSVKLLYDIYHMHTMGESPAAVIVKHLDCIGHLHVASPGRRSEAKATDDLDHESIYRQVTDAGYTGFWGHEFVVQQDAAQELGRAFKLFAGFDLK